MLEDLKHVVLEANLELPRAGLVALTWGNVSGRDPETGLVVIKPSGVPYATMKAEDMVVVGPDGKVLEGEFRPSTDTPTHLVLYRDLPGISGVVHTHSTWATAWAQAEQEIPLLGTTHADLMAESVPLTRQLTSEEVERDYEGETGTVLIELIGDRIDELPAALVRGHAPFCWAATPAKAVEIAVTVEEVARLALLTRVLSPDGGPLADVLRDKHHQRKHGPDAYYGQR
jgi:L-ribulose-5-phosphate 4-epimerase